MTTVERIRRMTGRKIRLNRCLFARHTVNSRCSRLMFVIHALQTRCMYVLDSLGIRSYKSSTNLWHTFNEWGAYITNGERMENEWRTYAWRWIIRWSFEKSFVHAQNFLMTPNADDEGRRMWTIKIRLTNAWETIWTTKQRKLLTLYVSHTFMAIRLGVTGP